MNNKLKTFFDILPILSSIILFLIISVGLFVYIPPVSGCTVNKKVTLKLKI